MYASSGLRAEVLLDRAGDIGRVEHRGLPLSWTSPVGYVPMARGGGSSLGFLRTFPGGLLSTCGLEHIFGAETEPVANSANPHASAREYPLHGSLSAAGATIRGHGAIRSESTTVVWCQLEIRQASVFDENLVLRRRIELDSARCSITVSDEIANEAPVPTEVMLNYHANFGYPLVAEGSMVTSGAHVSPDALVACPAPLDSAPERVSWERLGQNHTGDAAADEITLWHPSGTWGVVQSAGGELMRYRVVWEDFQRGRYALGLEHASNSPDGRSEARRRGEMTVLAPGATTRSWISWRVLPLS